VPLVWYRYGHAELLANALCLAKDHLKHGAVDRVIDAVHQRRADDGAGLTETVDAAFSLLVACRIPRQVVVDDGVEVLLEVDTLGEAVRGDQDAPPLDLTKLRDTLFALLGG